MGGKGTPEGTAHARALRWSVCGTWKEPVQLESWTRRQAEAGRGQVYARVMGEPPQGPGLGLCGETRLHKTARAKGRSRRAVRRP